MSNKEPLGTAGHGFRDLSSGRPVGNLFLRLRVSEESAAADPDTFRCKRCGYTWSGLVDSPKRCPNCGSFLWNRPKMLCVCQMCGHRWVPRQEGVPKKCPRCKSVRWNSGMKPEFFVPEEYIPVSGVEMLDIKENTTVSVAQILRMALASSVPFFTIVMQIREKGGEVLP